MTTAEVRTGHAATPHAIVGAVRAKALLRAYQDACRVGDGPAVRRLVAARSLDAAAAAVLLDTPHAELWHLAAVGSDDPDVLRRLVALADPGTDLSLAMHQAESLAPDAARDLARRISERARLVRDRLEAFDATSVEDDGALVRAHLDRLLAAGDALLTRCGVLDRSAVGLLQHAATPGLVRRWLAGRLPSQPIEGQVAELVASPGHAFGSRVADAARAVAKDARPSTVGYALASGQPEMLVEALVGPHSDAVADAIGPALLRLAVHQPQVRAYVTGRVNRSCGGHAACLAVGHALLEDWPDGIASLARALSAMSKAGAFEPEQAV